MIILSVIRTATFDIVMVFYLQNSNIYLAPLNQIPLCHLQANKIAYYSTCMFLLNLPTRPLGFDIVMLFKANRLLWLHDVGKSIHAMIYERYTRRLGVVQSKEAFTRIRSCPTGPVNVPRVALFQRLLIKMRRRLFQVSYGSSQRVG